MKRIFLLSLPLLLCQCSSDRPEETPTSTALNPARDYRPVAGEETIDDIARFLAGRPVKHGESLSTYQRTHGDYHTHALEFDILWRKIASKRRLRQEQYHYNTIRPIIGSPSTVVYPFGGPDVLYGTSMFPKATTYLLIGLEPVGTIPDLTQDPSSLLRRLSSVMDEPLRHGYFITKEMRQAPPVTSIILTSLGLMGAEVESAQIISAAGRPGIEFRFRPEGGPRKKLLYVSADLSNRGFDENFQNWLQQFAGGTAYFKAASYLQHDPAFSKVRDWTLTHCKSAIQDDSGIPYTYYLSSNWDVTLLGSYQQPIPLFTRWKQDDLASAYQAIGGRGPDIPFGSGYHLKKTEANLQICRKH
ncbi:MAG: hypothetical protein ACQKBU_06995 [Verrucomicrobiales bacterium]